MKKISCNGWAPRNIKWAPSGWGTFVPTTVPSITDNNKLFYNFYLYRSGGPTMFYYRLGVVLYNFFEDNLGRIIEYIYTYYWPPY